MIDITEKNAVRRMAKSSGKIILKKETIEKIKRKEIKKGDVFEAAKIAGLTAIKQTPLLLPYCHQIPIDFAKFEFEILDGGLIATCQVKAVAKTGVEMEALVGVAVALNTIWDMVKYLEKDENGQYNHTNITEIKILEKVKEK